MSEPKSWDDVNETAHLNEASMEVTHSEFMRWQNRIAAMETQNKNLGDLIHKRGNTIADLRGQNKKLIKERDALREALQVAEAFISVAMPHYAKERAEAVDEVLPLIRAALKEDKV